MWYKDGLKFECTGCGKCCTGAPGYVWVTEEECYAMADYLKMPVEDFVRQYVRLVGERLSLIERVRGCDNDCIFLNGKKCSVYEVRPKQCKTFPWWPQNLENEEAWKSAAKECEGISENAPLVSFNRIKKNLYSSS